MKTLFGIVVLILGLSSQSKGQNKQLTRLEKNLQKYRSEVIETDSLELKRIESLFQKWKAIKAGWLVI